MKITLIQIEKTNDTWLRDGIDNYEKRLKHYIEFEKKTLELKQKVSNSQKQKEEEEKLLLAEIKKIDFYFLLDEKGKAFTSEAFAEFMQKQLNSGVKNIAFIIGGAFGVSENIKSGARGIIQLSEMTFSHQMIRLLFTEQMYRAFTIIKGEKYHHI
jgi:23S rRNA (pseudouridine1915-N3)-methyltransferase